MQICIELYPARCVSVALLWLLPRVLIRMSTIDQYRNEGELHTFPIGQSQMLRDSAGESNANHPISLGQLQYPSRLREFRHLLLPEELKESAIP
jgi:hypothetical protein